MTGPPRNEMIAIHILVCLSQRAQPGDDGHDGYAQQNPPDRFCIANGRRDLILDAWIAQGIRNRIDGLHHGTGDGEAVAPRHGQGVEAEGLDARPHDYSAALSAAALASSALMKLSVPVARTVILSLANQQAAKPPAKKIEAIDNVMVISFWV